MIISLNCSNHYCCTKEKTKDRKIRKVHKSDTTKERRSKVLEKKKEEKKWKKGTRLKVTITKGCINPLWLKSINFTKLQECP